MKNRPESWLRFILLNFATPVVFFWTFHMKGVKPAIGFALGVTCIQLFIHLLYKIRFSPFFIVASGFTVVFGTLDLLVTQPRFFRLAPFAENVLVGLLFLMTAYTRSPIVGWFADALPAVLRPDLSILGKGYLKRVTQIWAAYFLVKAAFFLYLAFHVDLGSLIVLRAVLGGGSIVLMVLGEWYYRTRWRTRLRNK